MNQLLLLVNLATIAEGFVLGVKAGVDPKTLYEVIKTSAGTSYALENRYPRNIAKRNFERGFPINLACKDLALALNLAKENLVPLPITSLTYQFYLQAIKEGLASKDASSVIKIFEQAAGTVVKQTESDQ